MCKHPEDAAAGADNGGAQASEEEDEEDDLLYEGDAGDGEPQSAEPPAPAPAAETAPQPSDVPMPPVAEKAAPPPGEGGHPPVKLEPGAPARRRCKKKVGPVALVEVLDSDEEAVPGNPAGQAIAGDAPAGGMIPLADAPAQGSETAIVPTGADASAVPLPPLAEEELGPEVTDTGKGLRGGKGGKSRSGGGGGRAGGRTGRGRGASQGTGKGGKVAKRQARPKVPAESAEAATAATDEAPAATEAASAATEALVPYVGPTPLVVPASVRAAIAGMEFKREIVAASGAAEAEAQGTHSSGADDPEVPPPEPAAHPPIAIAAPALPPIADAAPEAPSGDEPGETEVTRDPPADDTGSGDGKPQQSASPSTSRPAKPAGKRRAAGKQQVRAPSLATPARQSRAEKPTPVKRKADADLVDTGSSKRIAFSSLFGKAP